MCNEPPSHHHLSCLRQPTVAKVQNVGESHRNGLTILKTVAQCLMTEADSWLSHVQALLKAKQAEEKAVEKAEHKALQAEHKAKERAQKRQEKLDAKKAEELAAATAEVDAEDGEDEAEDQKKQKRRRQRIGGQKDIEETDPQVLKDMSKFPASLAAPVATEVNHLADAIVKDPSILAVVRLKKGSLKKTLSASWCVNHQPLVFYILILLRSAFFCVQHLFL